MRVQFKDIEEISVYSQPIVNPFHHDYYTPQNEANSHIGLLDDHHVVGNASMQKNYLSISEELEPNINSPRRDKWEKNNEYHLPIGPRCFLQLGAMMVFMSINQIQMCVQLHNDDDTIPFRVLFCPLLYYLIILFVWLSMFFSDIRSLQEKRYFALVNEIMFHMNVPYFFHSIVFAIVGVLWGCSTSDKDDSSNLIFIENQKRETVIVIIWTFTHLMELLFWTTLIRIFINHNALGIIPEEPEYETEQERKENRIKQQQVVISQLDERITVNSNNINHCKNSKRTKNQMEESYALLLHDKIEEIRTLVAEKDFLETRSTNLVSDGEKTTFQIKNIKSNIGELQKIRNKNNRELYETQSVLEELYLANRQKTIQLSVTQSLAEQSRVLSEESLLLE